jgi:hypothetical protein
LQFGAAGGQWCDGIAALAWSSRVMAGAA